MTTIEEFIKQIREILAAHEWVAADDLPKLYNEKTNDDWQKVTEKLKIKSFQAQMERISPMCKIKVEENGYNLKLLNSIQMEYIAHKIKTPKIADILLEIQSAKAPDDDKPKSSTNPFLDENITALLQEDFSRTQNKKLHDDQQNSNPKKILKYTKEELQKLIIPTGLVAPIFRKKEMMESIGIRHSPYITDVNFPIPHPKILLRSEETFRIRFLHFFNPIRFIFQTDPFDIKQMEANLKTHYDEIKNCANFRVKDIAVDLKVAVYCDDKWYRAQIKTLHDLTASVTLLDQMTCLPRQVDLDSIYYLHFSFANIPRKSAHGSVHGLNILQGKKRSDIKECTQKILEILPKECNASLRSIAENMYKDKIYYLELFDDCGDPLKGVFLNCDMLTETK